MPNQSRTELSLDAFTLVSRTAYLDTSLSLAWQKHWDFVVFGGQIWVIRNRSLPTALAITTFSYKSKSTELLTVQVVNFIILVRVLDLDSTVYTTTWLVLVLQTQSAPRWVVRTLIRFTAFLRLKLLDLLIGKLELPLQVQDVLSLRRGRKSRLMMELDLGHVLTEQRTSWRERVVMCLEPFAFWLVHSKACCLRLDQSLYSLHRLP